MFPIETLTISLRARHIKEIENVMPEVEIRKQDVIRTDLKFYPIATATRRKMPPSTQVRPITLRWIPALPRPDRRFRMRWDRWKTSGHLVQHPTVRTS